MLPCSRCLHTGPSNLTLLWRSGVFLRRRTPIRCRAVLRTSVRRLLVFRTLSYWAAFRVFRLWGNPIRRLATPYTRLRFWTRRRFLRCTYTWPLFRLCCFPLRLRRYTPLLRPHTRTLLLRPVPLRLWALVLLGLYLFGSLYTRGYTRTSFVRLLPSMPCRCNTPTRRYTVRRWCLFQTAVLFCHYSSLWSLLPHSPCLRRCCFCTLFRNLYLRSALCRYMLRLLRSALLLDRRTRIRFRLTLRLPLRSLCLEVGWWRHSWSISNLSNHILYNMYQPLWFHRCSPRRCFFVRLYGRKRRSLQP